MTKKIIPFELNLKSSQRVGYTFKARPQILTNDANSAELNFIITDTSSAELVGATATVLLFMRDGSFFQNTDVTLVNNTFIYTIKPNQAKHSGVAQAQLVVKMGTVENASPLMEFEIVGGLETKPIVEREIQDWTSLTAEAKAFVEQIKDFTLEEFVENKMGEELSNLEVNYATRLTGLETKDNELTAQLAQTMTLTEFDSWVATLLDGGPSIFMDSLAILQSTYPNGASGVALVRETDPAKIYVWNGSSWEDFGDYQGIEVKNGTVTTEKLADKTVTIEKTDFTETGKNILDPSKLVKDKIISANDGRVYDTTSGNGYMRFIQHKPNTAYIKNWVGGLQQHAYYDANYNFISGESVRAYTTPSNCAYVSINIEHSDLTGLQVEEGTVSTPYEGFIIMLKNQGYKDKSISAESTDFTKHSTNLFDKTKAEWGYVISSNNGNASQSSVSYNCHSDYIKVFPNTAYRKNISNVNQVAFYDSKYNFISGTIGTEWTTPENCAYVRFNLDGRYIDITMLSLATYTAYEPYGIELERTKDKPDKALEIAFHTSEATAKCYRLDGLQTLDDVAKTYPFSDIKLCNVSKTSWGATKITYEGEAGFKRDGSNGEVMSEIPKHYFRRTKKDAMEYISISGQPKDGYQLDPAFIEDGKELEKIYVGVYDGSVVGDKLVSRSGTRTDAGHSITEYRDLAKANGAGFGLYDYRTYVMLQRLWLCYSADRNSQAYLGMGLSMYTFQTGHETVAKLTETNTNKIRIDHTLGHYQTRGFAVGMVVTVSPEGTYGLKNYRTVTALNRIDDTYTDVVFTGDPVDIVEGVSRVYSIPQNSGATDDVIGHTGVSSKFDERDGHEAVKFMHIENLWGNVWTLVDGYVSSSLVSYVGENMNDYSSDITEIKAKYLPLATKIPLQPNNVQSSLEDTQIFIRANLLDGLHPAYMLPEYLGSGATPNTMFSDPFYSHETGDRVMAVGGGIDHWYRGGLFSQRVWFTLAQRDYILLGARIIFKPI